MRSLSPDYFQQVEHFDDEELASISMPVGPNPVSGTSQASTAQHNTHIENTGIQQPSQHYISI
jgi:hypothetical protein